MKKVNRTEAEWREILDDAAFYVTRQAGTESPFTDMHKQEAH